MYQRKRDFIGTPEDFGKMERIQATAAQLAAKHFDRPYREMAATGCKDLELACAFIMFGYHILRSRRTQKHALDTFNTLAHFGRRRLEAGRARFFASKLN